MRGWLEGKVALVTGGTMDMGAAIINRLADEGAAVACLGRSRAAGEAVCEGVLNKGGRAKFVPVDISREDEVRGAVKAVVEAFGRLDIIVNNAAATDILRDSGELPVVDEPTEVFDQSMKVNLYGPFWLAKYGIPHMLAVGGGAIVSVSSINASRAGFAMPAYAASKAGLEGLMRQIANDYAAHGIRANSIGLGSVVHTQTAALYADPAQYAERARSRMLAAPGTPEDVANLVAFLASDQSRFMTGAVVPLDGGCGAKYPAPPIVPPDKA